MRERKPEEQEQWKKGYVQGKKEERSAVGDGAAGSREEGDWESCSFLQETIKPKPPTREQIFMQVVKMVMYGLIIGMSACCGFYALKPWAQRAFQEETQEVTLPEDEEEIVPEPEQEEEEPEPVVPVLTADSYKEIMQSMYAIAKDADKSIAYIRTAGEGDLLDEQRAHGGITGLIVADNGQKLLIFGDNSVCKDAEQWVAVFSDGSRHPAVLVKQDGNRGLAVFGVEKASIEENTWAAIQIAQLGNSNISARGDVVVALGGMFGYENGVGYGVISSKDHSAFYADGQCSVIATDIAAVSGGTGVLFNQKGEAVGLLKSGLLGEDSGLANALAISDMKPVMQLLLNEDSIPYVGISGTTVTDELSEEQGMPKGLYVTNVQTDSPAMKAGIQNGDVIQEVKGQKVTGTASYEKAVLECRAGDSVRIKGRRLGSTGYVSVDFTVSAGSME